MFITLTPALVITQFTIFRPKKERKYFSNFDCRTRNTSIRTFSSRLFYVRPSDFALSYDIFRLKRRNNFSPTVIAGEVFLSELTTLFAEDFLNPTIRLCLCNGIFRQKDERKLEVGMWMRCHKKKNNNAIVEKRLIEYILSKTYNFIEFNFNLLVIV